VNLYFTDEILAGESDMMLSGCASGLNGSELGKFLVRFGVLENIRLGGDYIGVGVYIILRVLTWPKTK